jgi:DNA modification methylase
MPKGFAHAAVEYLPPDSLVPYRNNARTHSKKQIKAIAASIERFDFTNPVLATRENAILAGHGRVRAAQLLGLASVPVLRIDHLSEAERRAYILADNRLAEKAGWDQEMLDIELQHLVAVNFDVEITGFEVAEIDLIRDAAAGKERDPGPEDDLPDMPQDQPAVTRSGDLWLFGAKGDPRHRLLAGDARDPAALGALMGDERAAMVLTDPPYNVAIDGHVSGNGRTRHDEFPMASGEMSEQQFIAFLKAFLEEALTKTASGALLYVFMDWRHQHELLTAARMLGLKHINLCVWVKSNGGMGSLYRSAHELVFVFHHGADPHRNNVELGKHGRSRTNVWSYAGVNAFGADRKAALSMHPTVKPAAMIADAIRDVTKQGDLILDPFGGSGTVIIAAEKTGRRARVIEIDGHYCDVALRRWEIFTGKTAVLAATGETFEEVAERRQSEPISAQELTMKDLAACEVSCVNPGEMPISKAVPE